MSSSTHPSEFDELLVAAANEVVESPSSVIPSIV